MAEAAITMHELYLEYVKAGFTEEQALRLILAQITAATRQ
jgi:hypothetical protein